MGTITLAFAAEAVHLRVGLPGADNTLIADLARHTDSSGRAHGILPAGLSRTNRFRTPYWGVVVFGVLALAITAAAGGEDQILVLFYAVAVFLSFLAGLLAMAKFSLQNRDFGRASANLIGVVIVGFTLIANLVRVTPLVSLAAALLISAAL